MMVMPCVSAVAGHHNDGPSMLFSVVIVVTLPCYDYSDVLEENLNTVFCFFAISQLSCFLSDLTTATQEITKNNLL